MNYKQQKLASLYETKAHSDCTFIFANCQEKIKAHKLLMTLSSPVFETMFYGDMSRNEILIEDIEPGIFDKLLHHVYTGGVTQIDNIEEAWNLFYACQKYFLSDLQEQCLNYIKNNLKMSNLLMCYEYGMLYGQEAIAKQCLNDVITYCKGILLVNNYHPQVETIKTLADEQRIEVALMITAWALAEVDNEEKLLPGFLQVHDIKLRRCFLSAGLYAALQRDLQDVVEVYNTLTRDEFAMRALPADAGYRFRYRTEFKNSLRLSVRRFPVCISPRIVCTCDCMLFGVAVATMSRPPHATSDHYAGGVNVYVYRKDNDRMSQLIRTHKCDSVLLKYDDVQKVVFDVPVLCKAYITYTICVEYVGDAGDSVGDSVLLTYMSDKLTTNAGGVNTQKSVICFEDEGDGDVVKGLCFYEV